MLSPDTLITGRYRLAEQIGQGGMGSVYRAHDEVLKRDVAVKVLKTELAGEPATVERFRREALIAASLSHPGIAQVFDFAEQDGMSFIVMELLKGTDLAQVLAAEGPIEPERAASIAAKAAEALHHAHENGAVHRDVKPANIYLTTSGAVKVTDFGIATAAEQSSLTKTGDVIGTAFYLSPEQVRGVPATAGSDIYALGCVLFEMVTARPPFEGESSMATALARLDHPAPAASELNPQVPASLDAVIARAMALEPELRFESAAAMMHALEGGLPAGQAPTQSLGEVPTERIGSHTQVLQPGAAALGTKLKEISQVTDPAKRPWVAIGALFLGLILLVLLARACGPGQAPARVEMPAVTGSAFTKAKAQLEDLGLQVRSNPVLSDRPAGTVVSQAPPPGTELARGAPVTLSLSSGQGVSVPAVTGLSLEAAGRELQARGLSGVVAATVSGEQDGVVMAQSPPTGAIAARGTPVRLTISERAEGGGGEDGRDGEDGGKGGRGKGSGKGDD